MLNSSINSQSSKEELTSLLEVASPNQYLQTFSKVPVASREKCADKRIKQKFLQIVIKFNKTNEIEQVLEEFSIELGKEVTTRHAKLFQETFTSLIEKFQSRNSIIQENNRGVIDHSKRRQRMDEPSEDEVNLYSPAFDDKNHTDSNKQPMREIPDTKISALGLIISDKQAENNMINLDIDHLKEQFWIKKEKLNDLNKLKVKLEIEKDLMQLRISEVDRLCSKNLEELEKIKVKSEFGQKNVNNFLTSQAGNLRESNLSLKVDYESESEHQNRIDNLLIAGAKASDSLITHKKEYKRIRNNFTESMPSIYQDSFKGSDTIFPTHNLEGFYQKQSYHVPYKEKALQKLRQRLIQNNQHDPPLSNFFGEFNHLDCISPQINSKTKFLSFKSNRVGLVGSNNESSRENYQEEIKTIQNSIEYLPESRFYCLKKPPQSVKVSPANQILPKRLPFDQVEMAQLRYLVQDVLECRNKKAMKPNLLGPEWPPESVYSSDRLKNDRSSKHQQMVLSPQQSKSRSYLALPDLRRDSTKSTVLESLVSKYFTSNKRPHLTALKSNERSISSSKLSSKNLSALAVLRGKNPEKIEVEIKQSEVIRPSRPRKAPCKRLNLPEITPPRLSVSSRPELTDSRSEISGRDEKLVRSEIIE